MSENKNKLSLTPQSYKELKSLYEKALKEKKDDFIFQNKVILTNYAKYLLEYVRLVFDEKDLL